MRQKFFCKIAQIIDLDISLSGEMGETLNKISAGNGNDFFFSLRDRFKFYYAVAKMLLGDSSFFLFNRLNRTNVSS